MSDAVTDAPSGVGEDGPDEGALAPPLPLVDAPEAVATEPPRRHRRTPLRTRRLRTAIVALVIVAVAVALPFLVVKATRTVANSKAGRTVTSTGPTVTELPNTPAALLVTVGPDHQVAGLTLLALDGSGQGGTAIVIPAGTEVPGAAGSPPTRLADAYAAGGLAAQREAVESTLGITTSLAAEVDEAGLTTLLQPYAPIKATLDDRAVDTGPNGKEVVLYPAGPVELTAAEAAHLLVAKGPNESEIARLSRTAAIWTAVLAKGGGTAGASGPAGASGTTATTSAPPTTAAGTAPATWAAQLSAVEAGRSAVRSVAARPVLDAVGNPDGVDLLAVDPAAMRLLLAQVMPGAISPANDNLRVRIVNNSGDPALLAEAVSRLVEAGANVVIISDPTGTTQQTLIEYQDPTLQSEAANYVPVVGPAAVRQSDERIDGIDATIVLGTDFGAFMQTEQAKDSVTTTSTTTP